jgi:hypothetical protein
MCKSSKRSRRPETALASHALSTRLSLISNFALTPDEPAECPALAHFSDMANLAGDGRFCVKSRHHYYSIFDWPFDHWLDPKKAMPVGLARAIVLAGHLLESVVRNSEIRHDRFRDANKNTNKLDSWN